MLGRETKRAEEVDASLHASRSARDGSLVPGRGHGASSTATPETAVLGSAAPGAAGLNSAAPDMAVLGPAAPAKATLCPARFGSTAPESGAQLGGGAWLGCAGDGCARPCSACRNSARQSSTRMGDAWCRRLPLAKDLISATETSCARRAPACLAETASSAGEGSRASSEGAVG